MMRDSLGSTSSSWGLPVLRVNAGSEVEVSVQSLTPVFADTHYFGRQFFCAGEDCPGCGVKPPRTRVFFLATLTHGQKRTVLVENSAAMWSRLSGLLQMGADGWQPGLLLSLSRRRANSPLIMDPLGNGGPVAPRFETSLPLLAALAVLHDLPLPSGSMLASEYSSSVRDLVRQKLLLAVRGG